MSQAKLRPLFIGLPGAGKTTLSIPVAARLGLEIVRTDPLFRIFRALPATNTTDPRAEVMRSFLARAAAAFPAQVDQLKADAETLDDKGRCALHDSIRFRNYGEDVFRLFEIEMLKWMDAHGDFTAKIVDLSASAPLYEENRALFAPANGYLPILIDTPHAHIAQNVRKDYLAYRKQSEAAGEKKPIRGNYEKAIDDALAGAPYETPEAMDTILDVAAQVTAKEAARRMDKYRAFARDHVLDPSQETLDAMTNKVVGLCAA